MGLGSVDAGVMFGPDSVLKVDLGNHPLKPEDVPVPDSDGEGEGEVEQNEVDDAHVSPAASIGSVDFDDGLGLEEAAANELCDPEGQGEE